ncbi:hypothetical protein I4U23_024512 [Adineta vaga]|nr:hypothetical protein I4U23_024512 [Adineta vaga]
MANEEDECDSSSLFTVASQSDINSFLHTQSIKIIGLNSNVTDTDDDDDDDDGVDRNSINSHLFASLTQNRSTATKSCLSRSCFASISTLSSSQKFNTLDDLTELKWLNTFKFKENKQQSSQPVNSSNDSISKLSNELKTFVNGNSISYGVLIFLALYSQRDSQQVAWSLTMKQIYEYIQQHHQPISNQRGWKSLLKQTLNIIPCFIKTKHETNNSCSFWTIDSYYRPLLTKAYLNNLSLQMNKNIDPISESVINHFPPKATLKTKAFPRLYERLCQKKLEKESITSIENQSRLISGNKRVRSMSSSSLRRTTKDNDNNHISLSLSCSLKRNKRRQLSHCQSNKE